VLTGAVFKEQPYSSAAICSMLARRLKAAGVDASLRAHAMRRGKMQDCVHKMGHLMEDVMQTLNPDLRMRIGMRITSCVGT